MEDHHTPGDWLRLQRSFSALTLAKALRVIFWSLYSACPASSTSARGSGDERAGVPVARVLGIFGNRTDFRSEVSDHFQASARRM